MRPIFACWPQSEELLARLRTLTGLPTPEPYTGSVTGTCECCDCAVWIGPRQQQTMLQYPGALVLCMACAPVQAGPDAQVHYLGNPERPAPKRE